VATSSHDAPVVVGLFFPPSMYGRHGDDDAAVAALRAIDPRVEVVVERYIEDQALRTIRNGPPPYEAARALAPALTERQREALEQAEVALALDLPFDVASLAPNLQWVQGVGAGVGPLQSAGLAEAGIRLTSASGTNATGIAEFVLARLLEHAKFLPALWEAQRAREWKPRYGYEIAGRTITLLGIGPINQAVAVRAKAFGLHVIAVRRTVRAGETIDGVDEILPTAALATALARSDAVVAAVPASLETDGLLDDRALRAMPRGGYVVNVGRGNVVAADALVRVLEDGHVAGAALDVFDEEPLPPTSPLWTAPNLAISAHCSSDPRASVGRLLDLFQENVRRYLAGESLLNEVG
jgi:phosphoglycerate dehydrogenase-like enzyme